MPERQVARPKSATPPVPEGGQPAPQNSTPSTSGAEAPVQAEESLDFTDSQFDDSSFGANGVMAIEVEEDIDPVQADIEQAAVLFANNQDTAARSVLEMSARSHSGANAERLWRMLLDLMQVLGDRPAFEKLGMEFAQACETSSPTWRLAEKTVAAVGKGEATVVLQGVISGDDNPDLAKLKTAIGAKKPVRIDLGKLASCDDEAASALSEMLRQARKLGVELTLDGASGLVSRLETRLVMGHAESPGAWLLLLEIYQNTDKPELFEEKAVDYAVTFEVSPPSWEVVKKPANVGKAPAAAKPADEALVLSGELKNYRFDELPHYLDSTLLPILDFSQVKRMDFFSAGLLRNTLEPYMRQGKEVVIRNPHHLVAELLGIVGVNNVARIIVTKF